MDNAEVTPVHPVVRRPVPPRVPSVVDHHVPSVRVVLHPGWACVNQVTALCLVWRNRVTQWLRLAWVELLNKRGRTFHLHIDPCGPCCAPMPPCPPRCPPNPVFPKVILNILITIIFSPQNYLTGVNCMVGVLSPALLPRSLHQAQSKVLHPPSVLSQTMLQEDGLGRELSHLPSKVITPPLNSLHFFQWQISWVADSYIISFWYVCYHD